MFLNKCVAPCKGKTLVAFESINRNRLNDVQLYN